MWGKPAATSRVASVLPPSTRIISRSGARGRLERASAKIGASFKTGRIREMTGFGPRRENFVIPAGWPGPAGGRKLEGMLKVFPTMK
jgi:hypothetical protein